MDYLKEYGRWLEQAVEDDMRESLKAYDAQTIEDAFYRDLSFGTGGLRGIIGAGTNRINVYTVGKASQGLANYLKNHYGNDASVAIGYDSRIKSLLFAQTAASVFAANGLRVYIWPTLNPVPALSFATRELSASAGVMITASHNPAVYNGYKVYGSDGCQITTEAAAAILSEIEKIDIFDDVKTTRFEDAVAENKIRYIEDRIMTDFIEAVKAESVLFGDPVDPNLAIVYSPLNGTGCLPVTRVLKESGYQHITLVDEQKDPDGYFPTCPYPNPEIREAMDLGITYAQANNADLLLATDPDCDRVGIAVKNEQGDYVLLTGNETGILLLDYICSQRRKHGKMPEDPVMIKTIVSTDLGAEIAKDYGIKTIDVLTGFKFIGEQIGFLEARGKAASYIFGFEESYGYLSGTYVRDKDGVNGAFLICEMFAYYQSRGISLIEKLNAIYEKYGYCLNTLHSFTFEGSAGFEKMQRIMSIFRETISMGCLIGGRKILQVKDYSQGLDGLPKSDVLKYLLEENTSVVIRPSGTEPKLKMYLSVSAKNRKDAENIEKKILEELKTFL